MVAEPMENGDSASSHYKTAGAGLILLGAINSGVAAACLLAGRGDAFIDYDMMLMFGISFVATGVWMRTYDTEDKVP